MSNILVQIIFGWPAIILSLVVSATGIMKRRPWMLALGGMLCIPFSFYLYLSGTTAVGFFALLLPLFQFGAVWAVHAKLKYLPWILMLPLVSVSVILAYVVIAQAFR